jgi:hypothetical protein
MASAKQNSTIWMGAYILTGGTYKPFYGYPIEFNVWNIDIKEQADFLGSANTQTLSGFERGNPMGFRTYANLDLDNSYPSDSSKILTLLNLLPSQYTRIFANKKQSDGTNLVTTSVLTSTTFTSAGLGSLGNDYYNGLLVYNSTKNQTVPIVDYTSSTVTVTIAGDISSWTSGGGDSIQILVPPSIPTLIGLTADSTNENMMYFNVDSSIFGISRELTIGNQVISMNLRGITRKSFMADNVRIGL